MLELSCENATVGKNGLGICCTKKIKAPIKLRSLSEPFKQTEAIYIRRQQHIYECVFRNTPAYVNSIYCVLRIYYFCYYVYYFFAYYVFIIFAITFIIFLRVTYLLFLLLRLLFFCILRIYYLCALRVTYLMYAFLITHLTECFYLTGINSERLQEIYFEYILSKAIFV